ncbi:hypothetical protein [Sediminicoccus sp. KRV36]|uniref:hypothetical protein n=1 Tax=Sediminicoccus sp. KRV36 TaxID=3133721 RepID=UPI00200BC6D3|nr:hypothetical protein [Sediminicoccus rosea]UPY37209.1 hypothetical protein LHU95_00515 [Sediminicoccus rosea]
MTELRPPAGGWTLAEAAATVLPELYAAAAKPPPKGWWMAGGAEAHKKERDAFRLAFSRLMEGGGYAADGVAEGDAGPSPISPETWRAAHFQLGFPGEPNLPAELIGGGQRWHGVRVTVAAAGLCASCAEVPHPPYVPPLSDLPEWWTLTQASVWIALRDTAAVRDAGPPHHGRDTRGVVGWHVDWACRKLDGAEVGPDPAAADELLAAAARRGAIRGRGTPHTSNDRRELESDDWALVTIAEDQRERGAKYLGPARGDGLHWRGVVVARDDVVREWPPFDDAEREPVEPEPVVLGPPEALPLAKPPHAVSGAATAAENWMRENVTSAGAWKRDGAIRACQNKTGATYREALAAWNALPEGLKGTRGRPRAAQ